MLIGHYAPAFALKAARPRVPLAALFVAVQLVDYGWSTFVLAGVERARIVPGYTASNDLDLYFMPYTHSLVASLLWALLAAGLAHLWLRRRGDTSWQSPALIGAAVFSHYLTDLLVHTPDLPLLGDGGIKLGLGLWNHRHLAFGLELGLFAGAAALYLWRSRPLGTRRWATPLLLTLMAAFTVYSYYGTAPGSVSEINLSALALYTALALLAGAVDRQRGEPSEAPAELSTATGSSGD